MLRRLSVLILASLLCGCSMFGKNVAFGTQIQAPRSNPANVIDVYFDRIGDLYPTKDVVIDDRHLQKVQELKDYFSQQNASCPAAAPSAEAEQFCSMGSLDDPAKVARWKTIQDGKFQVAAQTVAERLKSTGGPLVVLVHGFRVKNADRIYEQIRTRMDEHLANGPKPVYLLVHWDGLYSPTPFGVWGEAQVNGFLVGLGLRRVLAEVAPETPVRIMTHSSGAFVLSATLGDPAAVFELDTFNSKEFTEFRAHATGTSRYPLPRSRDLRAALIVPATPAWSFAGGKGPTKQIHPGMLSQARLIVGLNKDDIGVSKGPLNGRWSRFGSTDLGESIRAFCELKDAFARRPNALRVPAPVLADFQDSQPRVRAGLFWDSHDWAHYMPREKMKSVMSLLFDAAPGSGDPNNCSPTPAT